MKNLPALIITFSIFGISFAQKSESELLENYDFYVEKNIEMGKWSTKYYLTNGLVSVQENYWKNELRSRKEFKYDKYGNVERETNTFDINEGQINDISNLKLEYDATLLVRKEFDFGMTEKYSDFNKLGKPKLIERMEEPDIKAWPYKELIEYDKNGNVIQSIEFGIYEDLNGKIINEKATTNYKYDDRNNLIEIHREYEPKREFPIPITGGPFLYEYEYFRYKYNKNGLWTKKYKTVNGKEYLVAKRKYK
ncbi:hypothetical protein [uncultured Aquimarina sp.]|uniref:hypothetical protein n=1 Tax=uncultured Aquimarina sp. TaxID=575652 RepID=UPI002614FAE3|nr:hypothetical protein [uncultured Aquimarina sp.]